MTWEEFQEKARQITAVATEKIGNATDLAVLKLQLHTAKTRLRTAYEELGEVAYLSFISEDEESATVIAQYIKAITMMKEQVSALEKKIADFQL